MKFAGACFLLGLLFVSAAAVAPTDEAKTSVLDAVAAIGAAAFKGCAEKAAGDCTGTCSKITDNICLPPAMAGVAEAAKTVFADGANFPICGALAGDACTTNAACKLCGESCVAAVDEIKEEVVKICKKAEEAEIAAVAEAVVASGADYHACAVEKVNACSAKCAQSGVMCLPKAITAGKTKFASVLQTYTAATAAAAETCAKDVTCAAATCSACLTSCLVKNDELAAASACKAATKPTAEEIQAVMTAIVAAGDAFNTCAAAKGDACPANCVAVESNICVPTAVSAIPKVALVLKAADADAAAALQKCAASTDKCADAACASCQKACLAKSGDVTLPPAVCASPIPAADVEEVMKKIAADGAAFKACTKLVKAACTTDSCAALDLICVPKTFASIQAKVQAVLKSADATAAKNLQTCAAAATCEDKNGCASCKDACLVKGIPATIPADACKGDNGDNGSATNAVGLLVFLTAAVATAVQA